MSSASTQILAKSDLCRGLTEPETRAIEGLGEERRLEAGAVLFSEGDRGHALFVVTGGELEVTKRDRAGKEIVLSTLGTGAVIGELSLILNGASRSATVRATSATTLLEIAAPQFHGLIKQSSVAALKVAHNFAQVLGRRLTRADERLANLVTRADGDRREELGEFQKILQDWSF